MPALDWYCMHMGHKHVKAADGIFQEIRFLLDNNKDFQVCFSAVIILVPLSQN